MTQSPPDKMPDEIYAVVSCGNAKGLLGGTWDNDNPTETRYLNAATLADDLARVEELLTGIDGCLSHGANDFDEALTIIRRLRGNQ